MRQKIVAGNWKMNCTHGEAVSLATEITELLKNENTLSALAALKQDAKNFKFSINFYSKLANLLLKSYKLTNCN